MVLTGMAIINFINLIVGVMSNRHFAGKGLEADSMASLQIVQRGIIPLNRRCAWL